MASILQNLISKLGPDEAYKLMNKMKGGASQLTPDDLAKYPKNITQDVLAERQGFKMLDEVGERGFTMPDPNASVPALRTQTLPQSIIPEVVDEMNLPVLRQSTDIIPMAPQQASKKSNTLRNIALGAGGAGIIGGLSMLGDSPEQQGVTGVMAPVVAKKEAPKQEQPNTIQTNKESLKVKTSSAPVAAKTAVEQQPPIQPNETVDDYEARLAAARQQDADKGLLFGLLKAAQMGGSAMAGSKADTSFADMELSKADEFTNKFTQDEKLKEERLDILDEKKLKDPNSAESVYMREQMSKIGFPVKADISAADLKKQGINLSNLMTQKMAIDARKEAAALQREAMGLAKSEKAEQAKAKQALEERDKVTKLTDNLKKSDDYKAYNQTIAAQAALDNAIAKGDKTSVGSAFMMYAKIAQGDNSVVRESDMKNLAGSYNYTSPSEMLSKLSAKAAGGNFTPQELQQMKQVAKIIQDIKANQVASLVKPIQTRIDKYGIDAAEVIDPAILRDFSGNAPSNQESGSVRVISPDGKIGSIPAANLQKALSKGYKEVK